ncbi:hypothetical protein QA640_37590 [Bradyrhizobium sp. CB82]|uniref:hypothetical protein n=1 Tax=Bradyrhizobium sp. CB82 TaxID=3039159 RepID=UPI0024B1DD04|nr:hypothetical protein [Bradyrhizobium sp. CB82]WFU39946.1 hypothetical protein QA640_37590 [Bradyrhizobium sp. CB82]
MASETPMATRSTFSKASKAVGLVMIFLTGENLGGSRRIRKTGEPQSGALQFFCAMDDCRFPGVRCEEFGD